MPILSIDRLTQTIATQLEIDHATARHYAHLIMDLFGYEDRILDNLLNHHERQLFYALERHGLLTSGREETHLPDGRRWRIHYWTLRILKEQKKARKTTVQNTPQPSIYSSLPQDIWNRNRTGA